MKNFKLLMVALAISTYVNATPLDVNDTKKLLPFTSNLTLSGVTPEQSIHFSMRKDEIATVANFKLSFIASPALLPDVSQVIVYLNNDVAGVFPLSKSDMGTRITKDLKLNPQLLTTSNEIKVKFIGHYTNVCENPLYSSLWLKILPDSNLDLQLQRIPIVNDLAFLPFPFFDQNDHDAINLPVVFGSSPHVKEQQAAAILSSWFAAQTQWRGFSAHSMFNELPKDNAVVFATNTHRPEFLSTHAPVNQPIIEIIDNPNQENTKLLVLWGRNDDDLVMLTKALTIKNQQLRGASAVIEKFEQVVQRKPYDAPNWIPTNHPINFGELKTYDEQLSKSGLGLEPIRVTLNLPPDLYALSKYSASMVLKYDYTSPKDDEQAKFLIYVNNQFLKSIKFDPNETRGQIKIQLPIRQGLASQDTAFKVPSVELGKPNELRFEPYFMSPMPGGTPTQCITYQPIPNAFKISDDSTLDLTNFKHYLAMPNLSAFKNAGFPFSRMADLSDTLVVTADQPTEKQVDLLLNTVSLISVKTGLAGFNVNVASKNTDITQQDKDIILLTEYGFDDSFAKAKSQNTAVKGNLSPLNESINYLLGDKLAQAKGVYQGPISAIVGLESPYFKQRSVVALLANNDDAIGLLNSTLTQPNKTDLSGGIAIVRTSGISNIVTGESYYVGNISFLERLQIKIANHLVMSLILVIAVLAFCAYVVARTMRKVRKERIHYHD